MRRFCYVGFSMQQAPHMKTIFEKIIKKIMNADSKYLA